MYDTIGPDPVVKWFMACCLELLLWDSALVRFPVGMEFLDTVRSVLTHHREEFETLLLCSANSGTESHKDGRFGMMTTCLP